MTITINLARYFERIAYRDWLKRTHRVRRRSRDPDPQREPGRGHHVGSALGQAAQVGGAVVAQGVRAQAPLEIETAGGVMGIKG